MYRPFSHLRLANLAICVAMLQSPLPGMAQQADFAKVINLPDPAAPYPLKVRGMDLREALRLFAKNLRIGLVMDEKVSAEITGELPDGLTREAYLAELAALYDFVWYFDGEVLRVSPVGDIVIEVIPLRDNSGTAIINLLNRLGLYQPKFIHRADPRSRLLMVSGPSSYTEMVRKVATAAEEAEQTNITLIRGTEASVPTALDTLSQSQSEAPALPPPAILE